MNLSNDGLVAFHYRSYGTFFLHKNRLHNIHRGFTHYKYYRAKKTSSSWFLFFDNFMGNQLAITNLFIAFSIVDNLEDSFKRNTTKF